MPVLGALLGRLRRQQSAASSNMRHFSRAAQGAFCAPLSSRLEFRHAVGAHATNKSLRPPLVNGGQVRNLRVAPFSGSSCAETTTTNNKLHGAPLFAAGRGASCNAIRRARDSTESTSCIILDSWPQECRLQASQRETSVRLPHASAPDKTTIIIVNIIRLRAGSLARRSPPPLKSASAASRSTCVQIVGWQMTPTLFSDLAAPRPFASPNSRKRRQQVPCALRPRRPPPGGAARPRATCWEPGGSGAFVTAAAAAASITVGATRTRTERDRESSSRTEEAEKNQKPFDNKQR